MGKLFNLDSPVMTFLNKVADLIILNLIAMVFCIPIVTAGASVTALYYVTLKMVKNEEGYLFRSFWRSFRENFRQATILWLIVLLFAAIIGLDGYIMNHYTAVTFPKAIKILMGAVVFLFLMTVVYLFPVLSRFDNTVMNTIKNSFLMGVISLPKTILILLINALPVLPFLFPRFLPFFIMFGISGPAFLCSFLFRKTFLKFEPLPEDGETAASEEDDGGDGMILQAEQKKDLEE